MAANPVHPVVSSGSAESARVEAVFAELFFAAGESVRVVFGADKQRLGKNLGALKVDSEYFILHDLLSV